MLFILIDNAAGGDKKKSADKSVTQPPTVLADVANIKCKGILRVVFGAFRVLL